MGGLAFALAAHDLRAAAHPEDFVVLANIAMDITSRPNWSITRDERATEHVDDLRDRSGHDAGPHPAGRHVSFEEQHFRGVVYRVEVA
jgi:hypothetical protein